MALRIRYADVASTLALVIALGGTSYAVTMVTSATIQDETIQSVDVRNGTLRSGDLLDGDVRSVDIANGTITLADIAGPTKTALEGQQGPQGIQGIQGLPGQDGQAGADGADGADGTNGTNGVSGYVDALSSLVNGTATQTLSAEAVCPTGTKPLGGGYSSTLGPMRLSVSESHQQTYQPGFDERYPNGASVWKVVASVDRNGQDLTFPWSLRAWATCAAVS